MPIQKINTQEFLHLSRKMPVFDVRSPGEYNHAHIPGAHSLPLFTDEERKIVGTAYKQESREQAIKIGLDFFGIKMRKMVEEVESIVNSKDKNSCVLVHCWRGGMRSAGVAWLLDLYGYKVFTLSGGYKEYRKWTAEQFEKNHPINILSGNTGSGKTWVLHELKKSGEQMIDLEMLAHHKGSAFGDLGEKPQPTQEMFENLLATELYSINKENENKDFIWIEDESQRIGNLNLPNLFWNQMRNANIYFLDISFEERLKNIKDVYGKFEKEKLINAIIRIQKRLGGLDTKNAINFLLEDNLTACFSILLTYYDKLYKKGLNKRENLSDKLISINVESNDISDISTLLIESKNNYAYGKRN